jgi:putative transposase
MNYRRVFIPGASYFFTLTLQNRQSDLLICKIKELRVAFQRVMKTYPFTIDGIVVLPEHIHMTITLPPGDTNYSQRISFIKSTFSRQIEPTEFVNSSRQAKGERGIWQCRFWEHLIRDLQDYEKHLDYIHYNPVKHGHVKSPSEWPHSSIHRYIKAGILPANWASTDVIEQCPKLQFGE